MAQVVKELTCNVDFQSLDAIISLPWHILGCPCLCGCLSQIFLLFWPFKPWMHPLFYTGKGPPRWWASQPRKRVLAVGRALSEAASAWAAVLAAPHGLLRPLSEVLLAQELRLDWPSLRSPGRKQKLFFSSGFPKASLESSIKHCPQSLTHPASQAGV